VIPKNKFFWGKKFWGKKKKFLMRVFLMRCAFILDEIPPANTEERERDLKAFYTKCKTKEEGRNEREIEKSERRGSVY
jgi:hypothetical protein